MLIVKNILPQLVFNFIRHLPEAVVANLRYGFPGKKLTIIGVTGTDGKTTTVNLIYKILKDAGKKVSMISTLNATIAGNSYDTGFHVTSPRSSILQKFLKKCLDNGDQYVIVEVTSHAIDQFRVWGISFEVGVITNITHEHLDYHKTFNNYLLAKAKLIERAKIAVLNRDEAYFEKIARLAKGRVVSFGLHRNSNFNPDVIKLELKIPGEYNVLNSLAAAAVARSLGVDEDMIKKSLEDFSGLVGRMEEIKNRRGIRVIVDFAHTPNALEKVLTELRRSSKGRLISVFGCASERDVAKRPMMGEISAKIADVTVLTDEDPRFEDSRKILSEIAQGAIEAEAKVNVSLFQEPNRRLAIRLAIRLAKEGDTVGIFGKGHEHSINYRGVENPWSDTRVVQEILRDGR